MIRSGSKSMGRSRRSGSKVAVVSIKKKKPTTANLDKRIRRIVRKQEIKHFDVFDGSEAIPGGAGLVVPLLVPAQGAGAAQYIGNQLTLTSVQMRFELNNNTAALINSSIRVMIVYDKEGGTPTFTQVLDMDTITSAYLAPYNYDTQKRFKIMYDRSFVLNPQTVNTFTPGTGVTTALNIVGKLVRLKRRLNKIVKLLDNGTIETGSLHLMAVSDDSTNSPTIAYGSRVYFKDT